MKNKKIISLAMAAATVAPMAVPAFAAEVEPYVATPESSQQSSVDLSVVKGRAIKAVIKENLDEEMRTLEVDGKNPKVIFVDVDSNGNHGNVIIEYDQAHDADKVAAEKYQLKRIKEFIEYANSDKAIDADTKEPLYVVTTDVEEYSISKDRFGKLQANPSKLTVTVRENVKRVKSPGDFKTYTYVFENYDTKFEVGEEVVVNKLDLDLSKNQLGRYDENEYKKFRAFEYSLKKAVKEHGLVVTTNKEYRTSKRGYDSYIVNIYKKDKKTKVGKVTIKTDNLHKLSKDLLQKYNHVSINNDFAGHWAEETIVNAMLNGIVTTNTNYRPKENITRAEFATVIYNTLKSKNKLNKDGSVKPIHDNKNGNIRFSDVSSKDWFAQPIMELAKAGYINGNPDGTFKPDAPITRQEAAKIMSDVIFKHTQETYKLDSNGNKINVDIRTKFSDDSTIAAWADESVQTLVELDAKGEVLNTTINGKVISGDAGKNTFRGKDSISRAEALVMAERAGLNLKRH